MIARNAGKLAALAILLAAISRGQSADSFRFVILGDRTGAAQAGVYRQVWRDAAGENPAFVISVGDTIEGLHDQTAEAEWLSIRRELEPYRHIPFYPSAGNHDIWSAYSESLFRKYAGHAPHYSFNFGTAHFTVLDNSRTDGFSAAELAFLEDDLKAHAAQPLKFIVSHRPSWLVPVISDNPDFALHRIALKYGVQYVIAGHVHEMLHGDLDGVSYVSMASSGGDLRGSRRYEEGWFFGYAVVEVNRNIAEFHVRELGPPYGAGRVTSLKQWGKAGLREPSGMTTH